jgi:hypothetical protein
MSINQDSNSPIPDVDIHIIRSSSPSVINQSNQIAPLPPDINETLQKNEESLPTNLTLNLKINHKTKTINDLIKNLRNETIQLLVKIFQVKSITLKLYLILCSYLSRVYAATRLSF